MFITAVRRKRVLAREMEASSEVLSGFLKRIGGSAFVADDS